MKTLSIFEVIGINVSISYSNNDSCLLGRRTWSTQQHIWGMEDTQCSHKCIQLMSCPKIKTTINNEEKSQKNLKLHFSVLQDCNFFQITKNADEYALDWTQNHHSELSNKELRTLSNTEKNTKIKPRKIRESIRSPNNTGEIFPAPSSRFPYKTTSVLPALNQTPFQSKFFYH